MHIYDKREENEEVAPFDKVQKYAAQTLFRLYKEKLNDKEWKNEKFLDSDEGKKDILNIGSYLMIHNISVNEYLEKITQTFNDDREWNVIDLNLDDVTTLGDFYRMLKV